MDKKISQLTAKTIIELTDIIPIVDNSVIPAETKHITVANLLLSLRLRQGETNNGNVIAGVGWAVLFSNDLGTDTDGLDYDLIITCVNSRNHSEVIGYEITGRNEKGFIINPISNAFIEYTAILK
jgi:hypothetical protein